MNRMMRYSLLLRIGVWAAAVPSFFATQACYNYVPLESAPPVGDEVSLEITDRGRADLSGRFGPGLASIEGRLVQTQPTEYVINVYRVSQINGSHALWSGEQTHLSRDFVGSVRRRELSKVRTGLLVGGIAAVVVGLAARGISGSGSEAPDAPPKPTPISIRIPIHP